MASSVSEKKLQKKLEYFAAVVSMIITFCLLMKMLRYLKTIYVCKV